MLLSFLSLGLAASGISKVTQEQVVKNKERNILLVLDTSPSMAAEDIEGDSRWDAVLQSIDFLLTHANNENIGIILFSKNISFLVPFTNDYDFVRNKLNDVYLGLLGNETALADAIGFAYNIYATVDVSTEIVIVSDSNQNAGNFQLDEMEPYLSQISNNIIYVQLGGATKATFHYRDRETEQVISGTLLPIPIEDNYVLNFIKKLSVLYYVVDDKREFNSIMSGILQVKPEELYVAKKTEKFDYTSYLVNLSLIFFLLYWILRHIILRILW